MPYSLVWSYLQSQSLVRTPFASTLPQGATPGDEAQAYAPLLDHLGGGRTVVLGYSVGSGSAPEFATRHAERTIGLVLACCRLGGGVTLPRASAPLFRAVYSADRLFWAFKKLAPTAYRACAGPAGLPALAG